MALAARLRAVHTQNPGACVHYMRLYNQVVDIHYTPYSTYNIISKCIYI
jgi:hypothetical protein